MTDYAELEFRKRVDEALARAARVLENERNPKLAEGVPHSYADKYLLAEHVTGVAMAATMAALESMVGLDTQKLKQLLAWQRSGRSVTLRLKGEERTEYDREEKRDEEHSTSHELKIGTFKRVDKTVTTITEHFWRFTFSWEVFAFAGNNAEEKVCLLICFLYSIVLHFCDCDFFLARFPL